MDRMSTVRDTGWELDCGRWDCTCDRGRSAAGMPAVSHRPGRGCRRRVCTAAGWRDGAGSPDSRSVAGVTTAVCGTFTVAVEVPGFASAQDVRVALRAGDIVLANVDARWPERSQLTVPMRTTTDRICQVTAFSDPQPGVINQISIVVHAGNASSHKIVERFLGYSRNGGATTRPFPLPADDLSVTVSITPVRLDRVGMPLKVMAFNIWHGGRLDDPGDELVSENVAQLLEFFRSEDPDVLFVVETYGTGRSIEQTLNLSQPAGRRFRGIQLTRQPERPADQDNLWLYTWLPVAEIYPLIPTGVLTSFNFGGARVLLPDGTDVHAFGVWLYHLDDAVGPTTQAAVEHALGLEQTQTNQHIVATDLSRRLPMATALLDRLRAYVPDESSTVILGGDFNTLSHLDWSADHAQAPGHGGLVLDWPVMRMFELAGFTDSYRHANPDAARYPGDTKPGRARLHAPARIDYILTRGERVHVLGSSRRTHRLPHHRGGSLEELYPFYADHAAVVTELVIRGPGPGPASGSPVGTEAPGQAPRIVPPVPDAELVPSAELAVSATGTRPGSAPEFAVDGDPRTVWVADGTPRDGMHSLTIDLGRVRRLHVIRYQPPLDELSGLILHYSLSVSIDGETFVLASEGRWEPDQLPKDVHLPDVAARQVRLTSHASVGGCVAIAELAFFERGSHGG